MRPGQIKGARSRFGAHGSVPEAEVHLHDERPFPLAEDAVESLVRLVLGSLERRLERILERGKRGRDGFGGRVRDRVIERAEDPVRQVGRERAEPVARLHPPSRLLDELLLPAEEPLPLGDVRGTHGLEVR